MNAIKQDITKLKTVKEYAAFVGKTRATIYSWIDSGKLKTVYIGEKLFIKL